MLKLYETSNFRTLYDMLKINMKASSIKELENKTFEYNSNKYLSTKVIYGANAVGKSNIISRITPSMIDRNPRAPVLRLIACCAIALNAPSVKLN